MLEDGKIAGTFYRFGPAFNWNIKGVYDSEGNISYDIGGALVPDIRVKGKVNLGGEK